MNERVVLLNGTFVPASEATVPIMDRGLLFADSVYEGMGVLDRQLVDFRHHYSRLQRSLRELGHSVQIGETDLWHDLMELARRNHIEEGFLYLQITRGVAERDYTYDADLAPTVFAFVQPTLDGGADAEVRSLRLWSSPDLRWARRDLKTTNLLGQVMAKQLAHDHGADEGLLIGPDGYITECASRSFFAVIDGAIVARPLSNDILPGVTRRSMLAVAEELGLAVDERSMTLDEALRSDEAFTTGASSYVEPVEAIDDQPIGSGRPGPVTLRLRERYVELVRSTFWSPDR